MNIWLFIAAASVVLAATALGMYIRERKSSLRLSNELAALSRQLSNKSDRDALSGLLTRIGFDVLLARRAQKTDRSGEPFSLLYVALDNFGMLNDGFGSEMGDRLLQEVSRRLTQSGEKKVEACQVSVGEYAILVEGGYQFGRKSAKRLSDALAVPFSIDSIRAQLTCSIGIAVYPEHGSVSKLLGNAALAMRSVKQNGGADFCLYDPKMGVEVREQALLFNDLRSALDKGEFELYFQPKVDALSLQVTGAEALVRWHHSERGLISPVVFIPLAEQYGLIGAIGGWVIEEACRKAARWRSQGLRMRVAVNISGYQMREDDLVDRIEAALQRHGIQPDRFTCEITESVAMEDTKVTQATFDKMRNAGFHVSIDDFGTGYSSLAALRKLPAAELKIDRAFVAYR